MTLARAVGADRDWALEAAKEIGGPMIGRRGTLLDLRTVPAWVLTASGGQRVAYGFVTDDGPEVELVAMGSSPPGRGHGRTFLAQLLPMLKARGVQRIWCTTTNDNLAALALYQKMGFRLTALRVGAFADILALKGLPSEADWAGANGIALRDELELSCPLD